jgi:microcystin-dependent protein
MFGLINRGQLGTPILQEFENLFARLSEFLLKEHNEDGTHRTSQGLLNFVPVGVVAPWTTATAPDGWILCEGQQVERLTYSALFDVIGTTYGAGNGTTTFNVPNMQGRFPLGKAVAGTGSTLAGTGGTLDHVHSGAAHVHSIDPPNTTTGFQSNDIFVDANIDGVTLRAASGGGAANNHDHDVNIAAFDSSSAGAGDTGSANPPYLALNYIIFTGVA